MRVLICGGRDYNNWYHFLDVIDEHFKAVQDISIISGGARGADSLAIRYARENMIPLHIYLADWEKYGKSAGYKRNTRMLEHGQPDVVVAFPGGKGTAMMVDIARKAGVEVIEVLDDPTH